MDHHISIKVESIYFSISNNLKLSVHFYFLNFYHDSSQLVYLYLIQLILLQLYLHYNLIFLVYVDNFCLEFIHLMLISWPQFIHFHLYMDYNNFQYIINITNYMVHHYYLFLIKIQRFNHICSIIQDHVKIFILVFFQQLLKSQLQSNHQDFFLLV